MYQAVSPRRGQPVAAHPCASPLRSARGRAARETHAELTRLFERYGNAVFRAAYAYLHNRSDAEDVMQDTFLQYFSMKPTFERAARKGVAAARCRQREQEQARLRVVPPHGSHRRELSLPRGRGSELCVGCGARAAAELPRADPSVLPRGLLDRRDRVHFADAPIDHPFPSDTRPRDAARQAEGGV